MYSYIHSYSQKNAVLTAILAAWSPNYVPLGYKSRSGVFHGLCGRLQKSSSFGKIAQVRAFLRSGGVAGTVSLNEENVAGV